jgi:hypothetical protein
MEYGKFFSGFVRMIQNDSFSFKYRKLRSFNRNKIRLTDQSWKRSGRTGPDCFQFVMYRRVFSSSFSRNFGLSLMKVAPCQYFSRQVIFVYSPVFTRFSPVRFRNHPAEPDRTQDFCRVPPLLQIIIY